jgi:hypothetical protein
MERETPRAIIKATAHEPVRRCPGGMVAAGRGVRRGGTTARRLWIVGDERIERFDGSARDDVLYPDLDDS